MKEQLKDKNIILVGEGLFSEKEFPMVAGEINKSYPSKTFNTYFVNGQLRINTLSKEEKNLLNKFSEITGMEIKDMGELDINKAEEVAIEIEKMINSKEFNSSKEEIEEKNNEEKTKWICPICGYIHYGDNLPETCPLCGAPKDIFVKEA